MILEHPFRNMCDIHKLLDDCYKINTFCSRLEAQAEANRDRFDPDKFKGDGLECLVEFLLKNMGNHTAINIQDYRIVDSMDDTGVDGRGISTINKHPMTVQVKYRQANYILTANNSSLCNFGYASQNKYGVKVDDIHNMLIVTTAMDTHYYTQQSMLCGKVKTINRDGLRELVDNKISFWDEFKMSMLDSRTQIHQVEKKELRPHQQEALEKIMEAVTAHKPGKIILPTGTGKTLIQAAVIAERIKAGDKIFALFSPRILLSFQLLKEVSVYLQSEGIEAVYLNVNSGKFPMNEINEAQAKAGFAPSDIKSTTNPLEIIEESVKAKERGLPLIISSTYHSADQIKSSKIEIDIQLNDEAHHLVSEEFNKFVNVGALSYSFTATPKETDAEDGYGMQNPKFGEEIFSKTAREMIDAGEMLPPALHIISAGGKHSNNYDEIFYSIATAYEVHNKRLDMVSRLPDEIEAKMLVTLDGQETLEGILNCSEFKIFTQQNPDINILAMSSDVGIYVNGEWDKTCNNTGKQRIFNKMRTMEDNDGAIILYVDMLGEGIDVPGVTAFMPIRGISGSKFVQGVGRACRLSKVDRKLLYQGVMKPDQRACFVKPYAYIVIPDLTIGCEDYKERYKDILYELCDGYGLEAEFINVDHVSGIDKTSAIENVNLSEKGKRKITKAEIDQFYHEIREDLDRRMDIHEMAWVELYNLNLLCED